jgi:hypothetical protein
MHPELINRTPLAMSLLFLGREPDGLLHGVALVQGTWRIGSDGALQLVELQPEPLIAGQWLGDPADSSLRFEPQTAVAKPGCDVVLLGHAVAPGGRPVTSLPVRVAVGGMHKEAMVFGDRSLQRRMMGLSIGAPQPFERIPLIYERAFGGWDRRHDDPSQHRCEMRNPVGVGFRDPRLPAVEEPRLPNIEDPSRLYKGYGDAPPPCGFGFVSPGWMPRSAFGGTYDAEWARSRAPLLPADFDPRFHNAASAGLVATALRGDEPVRLEGVSPVGPCVFKLPGVPPPWYAWSLRRNARQSAPLVLDTVLIDMDQRRLSLQWRGAFALPDGPHALQALELRLPTQLGADSSAALAVQVSGEG